MARRNARLVFFLAAAIAGPAAALDLDVYDDDDAWLIESTAQNSLEHAETNQTSVWENPDTGSSGAITPIQTFQNADGQYCREYQQNVTIGGREVQAYGTACRMPDGSWQVASNEPAGPPPPSVVYREHVVYQPVYGPYYSRRDPVLFAPYAGFLPLALDIGLGYRDGYYRRGHQGRHYRRSHWRGHNGRHYRGGHHRGGRGGRAATHGGGRRR